MTETAAAAHASMERAPRNLRAWAACFDAATLPVLASTADELEVWRRNEDAVDAHLLAETISADPLMTLKLLAHVGQLRQGREGSDAETVTACLVMLGITPFFNTFGPQSTVEARLSGQPQALEGFKRVLQRAHRAADFAVAFAVHRLDHDAAVLYEAALLHDLAELLLWLQAPNSMLEIARRQHADITLRSDDVQQAVLGVALAELQHALMNAWRLPALLVQMTDENQHNESAQVRNVLLAVRVARHSAEGWDNAALPDDVHDIAELLQLGVEPTSKLLREIDGW